MSPLSRVSKYRRHKFAGPVLVVAALLTIGSAFSIASALPSATKTSASVTTTQIAEGKKYSRQDVLHAMDSMLKEVLWLLHLSASAPLL